MRPHLAALALGLGCLLPAQSNQRLPDDGKELEAAQRLRWHGDEAAAQARVRAILERQPDHLEARTFLGYVFFRGRWRLPEEMAYLRRAAGLREAAARAEAAAKEPPPRPPDQPAMAMLKPARPVPRGMPVVVGGYGLFDLRLQWVQNLGFETVPVSFGNGSGRLQLPRTQSVSFGGPIWLPLGFGP
jgi:hypothetical protein